MSLTPCADMEALPVFKKHRKSSVYGLCQGDVIDIKFVDEGGKKGATLRGFFVRRNSAAGIITVQTPYSIRPIQIGWIEKITIALSVGE